MYIVDLEGTFMFLNPQNHFLELLEANSSWVHCKLKGFVLYTKTVVKDAFYKKIVNKERHFYTA